MLASADFYGIAALIAACTGLLTVILGFANRSRLSTKMTNGRTNWYGRPKKKNIGDVVDELKNLAESNHELVQLLIDRTPRFDQIDAAIHSAVREGRENVDRLMKEIENRSEDRPTRKR